MTATQVKKHVIVSEKSSMLAYCNRDKPEAEKITELPDTAMQLMTEGTSNRNMNRQINRAKDRLKHFSLTVAWIFLRLIVAWKIAYFRKYTDNSF